MDSGAEVYGTLVSDIQSDVEVTGKVIIPKTIESPYVSRNVPVKYCNYVDLKKIIGASVVWNQLFNQQEQAEQTTYGLKFSYDITTHRYKISGTCDTSSYLNYNTSRVSGKKDHVYIIKFGDTFDLKNGKFQVSASTFPNLYGSTIRKLSDNTNNGLLQFRCIAGDTYDIDIPIYVTDLTVMFGTTIADYVYTLETAEAGTGIAWLQSYGFFTEDYYEYTENKIESVCTNGRTSNGITYPISAVELRGLFKLNNGELTVDGDEYEADGTITRKYGIVDLGDLEYNRTSTSTSGKYRFTINFNNAVISNSTNVHSICSKYELTYGGAQYNRVQGYSIYTSGDNKFLAIYDDNYAEYTVEQFRTVIKGKLLIYELATPEIDLTTPFNERQKVGSTEQFDDYGVITGTRDVCIPVGNETDYLQNFAGQITGTLHYIEDGLAPSGYLSGSGNFIALHLNSDDWSRYTSVKVGLDPSQASGMVEILNDEEKIVVGKITDNEQVFIVESTDGEFTKTDVYSLTDLVLETE